MTDDAPIEIVVPFPPGGIDLILRLLVAELSRRLGQRVAVINRPGRTGALGTAAVARAATDGRTLLFASQGPLVYQPQVNAVDYDVRRSFAPVCRVTSTPSVLIVASRSGLRSVADVVAAARAAPGKLAYSSPGPGGLPHIGMAAFCRLADIEMRHLPCAGAAAAIAALASGEADLLAEQLPTAMAHAGDATRIVAVFATARLATLAEVPTLQEAGWDIALQSWNALLAPAGTPAAAVERLSAACKQALDATRLELRERMGMEAAHLGPAETAAFIDSELQRAAALARRSGLAPASSPIDPMETTP